jgi:hypothetical protein
MVSAGHDQGPPRRSDDDWDERQRDETPTERLDRNWAELLQELRVVQTGVQFLTGFLLTLPFQQRFAGLTSTERDLYLSAVAAAVLATALVIAPVALHRMLFRQHARPELVTTAHRLALAGYCLLGLAVVAVVALIFDVVDGGTAGLIAGLLTATGLVALWGVLPAWQRGAHRGAVQRP